jgi:hypothetical protein
MTWSLSRAHVFKSNFKSNFKNNFKSMMWNDMEPDISELTQWSGSLTGLASDLGQARQKYICTNLSRQLTSLAPTNEESSWLNEEKNHIGKKIVSCMSACDVTCVVSLVTNNLKRKIYESGE